MLPATILDPVIVDTVLGRLAVLFLLAAGDDLLAARISADRMVARYKPSTEEELCLAADIVGFRFHAMDSLRQASCAGLSLNKQIRLRGNAASLNREAHRSQHKLDQLQRDRLALAASEGAETAAAIAVTASVEAATEATMACEDRAVFGTRKTGRSENYQEPKRAKQVAERTGVNPVVPSSLPRPALPPSAAAAPRAG